MNGMMEAICIQKKVFFLRVELGFSSYLSDHSEPEIRKDLKKMSQKLWPMKCYFYLNRL